MDDIIANAELVLIRHTGETEPVTIAVTKPYPDADCDDLWRCEIITQSSEYSNVLPIENADSFLTLISAVSLLNTTMQILRMVYKNKGRLLYLDEDASIDYPFAEIWRHGTTP